MKKKIILLTALLALFLIAIFKVYDAGNQETHNREADILEIIDEKETGWLEQYVSFTNNPDEWKELYPFDNNGIVQVDYGEGTGIQYNPTTISQYALANYNYYLKTSNEDYKKEFLNQIEYLKQNYNQINNTSIGYPYNFYYSRYDLQAPWYSAIAQGNVISALVRAYHLAGDESLPPIIKKAKNFLVTPTSQGGLLTYTPEGNVWLEEYPTRKPSLVLNGFVFAVIGLYDYLSVFPEDQETQSLYEDCLMSIKESMIYYDTGSWLKYERYPKDELVNERYMKIQTLQNAQLYLMTGDEYFLNLYKKWDKYIDKRY